MSIAYKILDVDPNASEVEIKKAYRKKASKLHPDKGGSPEEFAQLQAAYEYAMSNKKGENKYKEDDFFKRMFGGKEGPYKR